MEEEKKGRMEFLRTRKGRILSVVFLAACAVVLFKPFLWIDYFSMETPLYTPVLYLHCVLPALAAFIAGPAGAIIVAACAVCPRIILYPLYYPSHFNMVIYNVLLAVNEFAQASAFSCVLYSIGKKGSLKNIPFGLLCGALDFAVIRIFGNCLTFRLIDKTTPIPVLPGILMFLVALTAHIVVFLLQRREKASGGR